MQSLVKQKGANFEHYFSDNKTGKPRVEVMPPAGHREVCFTVFERAYENDKEEVHNTLDDYIDHSDPTFENVAAIEDRKKEVAKIYPQEDMSLKTKLFIDRFLLRIPWKDLEVKYDKPKENLQQNYNKAKKRVVDVLTYMDDKDREVKNYHIAKRKINTKLNADVKCYLLRTLFGLSNKNIAEIAGCKEKYVADYIGRINRRLRSGENILEIAA
jgi:hypothetical protein